MAVLATGCSGVGGGAATPATSTAGSTAESTSTKPSTSRPREIKLDGVKPCELMTPDQLAQIGKVEATRPGTNATYNSPDCAFHATGATWGVTTVMTEGVEAWTSRKRQGRVAEMAPIAGFPAMSITLPDDQERCDVVVDVANGQYLNTDFEIRPSFADRFPKPCDGARQVAEAAMQNLTK
jgi:hypothetical protein